MATHTHSLVGLNNGIARTSAAYMQGLASAVISEHALTFRRTASECSETTLQSGKVTAFRSIQTIIGSRAPCKYDEVAEIAYFLYIFMQYVYVPMCTVTC